MHHAESARSVWLTGLQLQSVPLQETSHLNFTGVLQARRVLVLDTRDWTSFIAGSSTVDAMPWPAQFPGDTRLSLDASAIAFYDPRTTSDKL